MVKSFIFAFITINFVFSLSLVSCSAPVIDTPKIELEAYQEPPVSLRVEDPRKKLKRIYTSFIGVREANGKNDGPEVEMFLRNSGLGKGYAWCAAFVKYCFDSAGIDTRITAWSPSAHNKDNIVYFKNKLTKEPKAGDVFTIYYLKLKRIGHTGFVDGMLNKAMVRCVEGNTNANKSNEGDGVYLVFRPLSTLYSITSWID